MRTRSRIRLIPIHTEGRASAKQSTKDEANGKLHVVKGKVKEQVGRATNNPDL